MLQIQRGDINRRIQSQLQEHAAADKATAKPRVQSEGPT
jgi:hypothetical protein